MPTAADIMERIRRMAATPRNTASGYVMTMEMFVAADPAEPQTIAAAVEALNAAADRVREMLPDADVVSSAPKWRPRRRIEQMEIDIPPAPSEQ
jgi:hypothetical protein